MSDSKRFCCPDKTEYPFWWRKRINSSQLLLLLVRLKFASPNPPVKLKTLLFGASAQLDLRAILS